MLIIVESPSKAVPFDQTNTGLYNAFLGRRIGNRLVGNILSPITSKALRSGYRVGRVQFPAVRLVTGGDTSRAYAIRP